MTVIDFVFVGVIVRCVVVGMDVDSNDVVIVTGCDCETLDLLPVVVVYKNEALKFTINI